ncbi:hypothetical protein NBM05_14050 [Rothia sp. AR01]|uniref:Uncharacterized protein n=1 Tax=Rothia santali TaxID=2949643 RepID=A0A9X2KIP2_9MICC|nr:hypothetical protein [Rothia santali]MCP3427102.1 hypothetical protein [Rothia santali]
MKGACGVALFLIVLQALTQAGELASREGSLGTWEDTGSYAVFYPRSVGEDLGEIEAGGHASKAAEAGPLYEALDAAGALFVDASAYEAGGPSEDPTGGVEPPRPVIRVNANYLERYPLLDADGGRVGVAPEETAWVVAVPETYRDQEERLRELFTARRIGSGGVDGAVQASEGMLGSAPPDRFREQAVRIVWTAAGQRVFGFSTLVAPEDGHLVEDPIVEVMTPSNSLPVDRLNAVTGELNAPLKVPVGADPAGTLRSLQPMLAELRLQDNLRHLVTTHEAVLGELRQLQAALSGSVAAAVVAFLALTVLGVALVAIVCDRDRLRLTVRRLHGHGFWRTHRETLALLGGVWGAQLIVAVGFLAVRQLRPAPVGGAPAGSAGAGGWEALPPLLAVAGACALVELCLAAAAVLVLERRHLARRLREL